LPQRIESDNFVVGAPSSADGVEAGLNGRGFILCAETKADADRRRAFALFCVLRLPCAAIFVAASAVAAHSEGNGPTVVHGRYVEQHYFMEGQHRPVAWTWEFTLNLSGKSAIHEEWSGHNNRDRQKSNSQEYTLGEQAGGVAWRVLGSNQLQKTVNFRQHTMILTITTSGAQCHLDVTFRLKPGFTDILLPRGGKGELTHFSLPKTLESSCAIS
jgi:hypothetical protein